MRTPFSAGPVLQKFFVASALAMLTVACNDEPHSSTPTSPLIGEVVAPSAPVSPSIVEPSTEEQPARPLEASRRATSGNFETFEIYTKEGRRVTRMEGPYLGAAQVAAAGAARPTPEQVDSLIRVIDEGILKGGRNAATLRRVRQIIDVMRSPNAEIRHQRVRQLPVTLVVSTVRDEQGRLGVQKVYTHESGRTVRTFSVISNAGGDGATTSGQSEGGQEGSGPFDFEGVSPFESGSTSAFTDCEYTDDDSVYWSGPCATQSEVEDATIEALAMDAEAAAAESDAESTLSAYCLANQWDYEACAESDDDGMFGLGGPSDVAFSACSGSRWTYAAALGHYAGRAWNLWRAISITTPAGAISNALYWGGVAVLALTGTTINMQTNCAE